MSDVAKEMARRARIAEDREADPTLEGVWDGNSTQPDMDSHQGCIAEVIDEPCGCDDCNGIVLFV